MKKRKPYVGSQFEPAHVVGDGQQAGPLKKVDRGLACRPGETPAGPPRVAFGSARSASPTPCVEPAELGPVAESPLEVVAEELLVLAGPLADGLLEPGGVALVELGARLLRQRLVGRVADEGVAEAERLLSRERRAARCGSAPSAPGS